jgi:hypothetical protein
MTVVKINAITVPAAGRSGSEAPGPVGVSSELWSYETAGGSPR